MLSENVLSLGFSYEIPAHKLGKTGKNWEFAGINLQIKNLPGNGVLVMLVPVKDIVDEMIRLRAPAVPILHYRIVIVFGF